MSARDDISACRAEIERESFYAAADEIDVDDAYDCGGCSSCVIKAAAVRLREKAGQSVTPLIVARFDVAIEPAPEAEPVPLRQALAVLRAQRARPDTPARERGRRAPPSAPSPTTS
ncbi:MULTISPECIES: hypothetical protein [Streptomyces]|uniref:hypothetical protein n=1 Tax=Streptomyces TaxID=1883 RepID=UPI000312916C|nr:hypothetical protein [Streptomyces sp. TOR3209]